MKGAAPCASAASAEGQHGGPGRPSATQSNISAAPNDQDTGYRSEPQTQSVGAHGGGAGAIGKQSQLLLLS